MIAQIRGRIVEKATTRVVVDVQGLGFELLVPLSTYDHLPLVGEEVTLFTYLQVREDALVLFAFATTPERDLFHLLISAVTGIGPKLALNVLSGMPVASFCAAVANKDVKVLSTISGIGKRSAERFVVELSGKLAGIAPTVALTGKAAESASLNRDAEDAVNALTTLGFKADQARQTVRELLDRLPPAEQTAQNLIRQGLAAMKR